MKQVKCFSCGKKCDPVKDKCYGCHEIVCISCANEYGHFANGKHGKKSQEKDNGTNNSPTKESN